MKSFDKTASCYGGCESYLQNLKGGCVISAIDPKVMTATWFSLHLLGKIRQDRYPSWHRFLLPRKTISWMKIASFIGYPEQHLFFGDLKNTATLTSLGQRHALPMGGRGPVQHPGRVSNARMDWWALFGGSSQTQIYIYIYPKQSKAWYEMG